MREQQLPSRCLLRAAPTTKPTPIPTQTLTPTLTLILGQQRHRARSPPKTDVFRMCLCRLRWYCRLLVGRRGRGAESVGEEDWRLGVGERDEVGRTGTCGVAAIILVGRRGRAESVEVEDWRV